MTSAVRGDPRTLAPKRRWPGTRFASFSPAVRLRHLGREHDLGRADLPAGHDGTPGMANYGTLTGQEHIIIELVLLGVNLLPFWWVRGGIWPNGRPSPAGCSRGRARHIFAKGLGGKRLLIKGHWSAGRTRFVSPVRGFLRLSRMRARQGLDGVKSWLHDWPRRLPVPARHRGSLGHARCSSAESCAVAAKAWPWLRCTPPGFSLPPALAYEYTCCARFAPTPPRLAFLAGDRLVPGGPMSFTGFAPRSTVGSQLAREIPFVNPPISVRLARTSAALDRSRQLLSSAYPCRPHPSTAAVLGESLSVLVHGPGRLYLNTMLVVSPNARSRAGAGAGGRQVSCRGQLVEVGLQRAFGPLHAEGGQMAVRSTRPATPCLELPPPPGRQGRHGCWLAMVMRFGRLSVAAAGASHGGATGQRAGGFVFSCSRPAHPPLLRAPVMR